MLRDPRTIYKAKTPEFDGQISEPEDYPDVYNHAREIINKTGQIPESLQYQDLINFIQKERMVK